MVVLGVDPSGNFDEGKGITGFCRYDVENESIQLWDIKAKDFKRRVDYWNAVRLDVLNAEPNVVVVEDYILYNNKNIRAATQTNSQLETPRLLGLLEFFIKTNDITLVFQKALTKKRFDDNILVNLGYLIKDGSRYKFQGKVTNDHERDSLRHVLYYLKYGRRDF